jgi:ParB family chromosome partitioning protein
VNSEDTGRRRASLGRGLDALFGEEQESYGTLDRLRQSRLVPIEFLSPNPYQPRRRFDEAELGTLVESIRTQGILQPILVRVAPGRENHYQIIAGERRWRAAQQAQLHEVPVLVRDLSDEDALQIALIENLQRQDLTALEEADGFRRLMEEFTHTQEEVARIVGKSRSHVANTLRLLDLPAPVQQLVQERKLTAGHARALLGCPDPVAAAREVIEGGLNVRQTEALARAKAAPPVAAGQPAGQGGAPVHGASGAAPFQPPPRPPLPKDPDTMALEQEMSSLLGLRVSIASHGDKGGSLTIHYGTLEQLDDVLHRLSQGSHGSRSG